MREQANVQTERERVRVAQSALAGSLTLPCSVFVVLYEASEAKISHLTHQVLSHQDVGGPEVPVDVVHSLHIRHARGDLRTAQQAARLNTLHSVVSQTESVVHTEEIIMADTELFHTLNKTKKIPGYFMYITQMLG